MCVSNNDFSFIRSQLYNVILKACFHQPVLLEGSDVQFSRGSKGKVCLCLYNSRVDNEICKSSVHRCSTFVSPSSRHFLFADFSLIFGNFTSSFYSFQFKGKRRKHEKEPWFPECLLCACTLLALLFMSLFNVYSKILISWGSSNSRISVLSLCYTS